MIGILSFNDAHYGAYTRHFAKKSRVIRVLRILSLLLPFFPFPNAHSKFESGAIQLDPKKRKGVNMRKLLRMAATFPTARLQTGNI